ncbi:arylesterase [Mariniradius sediminis]|uniref:Arylesterase n=1 Tax=Mariniradius sediminis TaxID=2909237 RepID=A0ABS9BTE2_9BACT|nr:arylesterase [Mariniradius sediminis]MCF1751278.1 arylesterase [Mariniradius sediminis]
MKIQRSVILLATFLILLSCTSSKKEENKSEVTEESSQTLKPKKLILFFGNSLTAGYGIELEEAFPGLTAQRIDSLGLEYRVINAGLSGETTASGLSRLEWFLEEEPAIFVLELGANDGLRGITPDETKKNLKGIVQLVKSKYPSTRILLAGMQIPPNMGQEFAGAFRAVFPEVAQEENVTLIPFLLEGVAGDPDLNLPDGIHPTEAGHKIVFETIWPYLEREMEK